MRRANIAVLVSGGGTNLQALLDAQTSGILKSGRITLVISNHPDAFALERAKKAGVATAVITKKACGSQAAFEKSVAERLEAAEIDLIILAGFMSILSGEFTRRFENRILNVHPSLIPAFCGEGYYGLRVHQAVLDYGAKVTGATVHYVNEIPDGGRIIAQKAVEVAPDDTPQSLQKKVMQQAEWILLPRAAEEVSRALLEKERLTMETYCVEHLEQLLSENAYPGRGIVLGQSPDGKRAAMAYFIMGRSENSRNRIFEETEDGIRTQAYDPSKMADPSLIIYHPVRTLGGRTIVTNGDQTDTIREFLENGETFEAALRTRTFEPDGPNWTPRISGLLEADGSYRLSILKSADEAGSACLRETFEYPGQAGIGHFLHTYACDGNPIPSFRGEPEVVAIPDGVDALTEMIWNNLDEDNKISLFVRYIDLETGAAESRLVNKHV